MNPKEIALQFLKMIEAGNIDDAYQKHAAADGKHHNPFFAAGFPALREGMKENHVQFPNKRIVVKNVIGEDDLVAVHFHVVLNPGDAGIIGVHLFRFQDDKIVELWDCGQPVPDDSPNKDGAF